MEKSINAVGFTLEQKQSDMIESKLKRIAYAEDLIINLTMKSVFLLHFTEVVC